MESDSWAYSSSATKDSLKVSLKNFRIDLGKWKSVAIEGTTWCRAIVIERGY